MMVAFICFTVNLSLQTSKCYQDVYRVQLMWHLLSASALIQYIKCTFESDQYHSITTAGTLNPEYSIRYRLSKEVNFLTYNRTNLS
jgi:uncharacterized membrane-anchored protein YhcB (DUF1043 family)